MTLTVSISHIMDYINSKGVVRLKDFQEPAGNLDTTTNMPSQHEKKKAPLVTVGVLTTANKRGLPGGEGIRIFKEMVAYGNKYNVAVFFFFPRDVNWKRKKIAGLIWNGKIWRKKILPFPDIVYNRIRFRNIESQEHVKRLLRQFEKEPSIHLFNSRFLNKWEVYKALMENDDTAYWLPETVPLSRQSLAAMLRKYPEVFLKCSYGSLGKGIIKINRLNKGQYVYAVANKGAVVWKKSNSIDALYRQLYVLTRNAYLVQRGIDLACYKGRVFDLRTQYQKNGRGEWVLTGVAVRVAGKNRFVTHIPNGGFAASFEKVMNEAFPGDSKVINKIYEQLEQIRKLPPVLEEKLNLSLAVLSMDIGVDKTGRIWVIEVNSKPAKFDEIEIRNTHWQYLMEYFIYLAQKTN